MTTHTTVTQYIRKWGNANAVRLPQQITDAVSLTVDQPVEVTVQGNSIVMTPIATSRFHSLDTMFHGVEPSTVAGEYDWGDDVGAERYE